MLGHSFSVQPGRSLLVKTLPLPHILLAQSLNFSQKGSVGRTLGAWTQPWAWKQPYRCVCPSRFQGYFEVVSRPPNKYLIPWFFHLSFWLVSCLPNYIHCLWQPQWWTIVSGLFFHKCLQRKGFCTMQALRSNKDSLAGGDFQGTTNRSNNDSLLGMGLWRRSNPNLPPPMTARLLVSTVIVGCWFSKLLWSWRGEIRIV